jgi:hypothetical protein
MASAPIYMSPPGREQHEEKNIQSNSPVHVTSDQALSTYVANMAIRDEMAAEVTAVEMGWEPVKRDDGTIIWVRSKDIGLDKVPYCDTALEVIRTYTH